jgi:hypothetical protein
MTESDDAVAETRAMLDEEVYESSKLKELGWSRTARRIRPLKGWFGLAQESRILTSKVDVDGSRRVLEQVRQLSSPAPAEE